MAQYYINSSGSDTAPFDTPAKGANTFNSLLSGASVTSGDFIDLVDAGVIDQSAQDTVTIPNGVIVRSWSSNTSRPIIQGAYTVFHVHSYVEFYDIDFVSSSNNVFIITLIGTYSSPTTGVIVERCSFRGTASAPDWPAEGIGTFGGTECVRGLKIKNCTFKYLTYGIGVNPGGDNSWDNIIINNTFIDCLIACKLSVLGGTSLQNLFINNIVYRSELTGIWLDNPSEALDIGSPSTVDKNFIYVADGTVGTIGTNAIVGEDPRFLDLDNRDYRLLADSPAIDAGALAAEYSEVPSDDYLGNSRPYQLPGQPTAGIDMGAYEMHTAYEAPTITSQSSSSAVELGSTNTLSVVVTGTGTETTSYQWYKDGEALTDTGNVSGSQTASLTITETTEDNVGDYYVVVSNGLIPDATSETITLSVLGMDLPGTVNVASLSVVIGSTTLSADFQTISIPYTGYASPTTTDADITVYEYSTDNGSTWETMTLNESESDLSDLTFDASGEAYTIVWEAKTDLGMGIYNNQIRLRMRAQCLFDDDTLNTAYATKNLFIERTIVTSNQAAQTVGTLPTDYKGVPGSNMLKRAPKTF